MKNDDVCRVQVVTEKKGIKDNDSYFDRHFCMIPPQRRNKNYDLKCNAFFKLIFRLTTVEKGDIRARHLFTSNASLHQEIHRQYSYYSLSIHPYSRLRFFLEAVTVFNLIMLNAVVTIFYCETQKTGFRGIECLEILYIPIIAANCFTGYVEENTSAQIILDLKKIMWRYFKSYFIIDVLSITGLFNAHQSSETVSSKTISWAIIFDSAKILRLPTLHKYINNLLIVKEVGTRKKMVLHVVLLLYNYLQWNIFFQFATEYYSEGTYYPQNSRNCSWMTTLNLWNETLSTKFVYAFHRAAFMLRENSVTYTAANTGCLDYFYIIAWLVAKLMVLNGAFIYTINSFGLESARAKYFMMAKQVQTFMEHRKFPPRLKKKILKFYAIRFQSHFFLESRMIACMSGQLREDILMHTGRQLISDVEFLKTLPRQLHLQIGMKLGIVIFIAGDIIFKINTTGDCMYFIDRGTVAIYSESGKEVCHLHDGDFFGEIALVMKHRFRTASVVAVSNCELFRLDRGDFESSIACYPTVYEEIKRVATNRFDITRVMDDHYRNAVRESIEHRDFET